LFLFNGHRGIDNFSHRQWPYLSSSVAACPPDEMSS
jgi:hypothetical protein